MNSQSDIKDQQLIRDLLLENKALERGNKRLRVELDNQLKDYGDLSDCLENELSKSNTLIEKNKVLANHCHFLDAEYTKKRNWLLADNQNLKSALEAEIKVSTDLAMIVEKLRSEVKIDKHTIVELTYQVEHITLTKEYHELRKELIDMTTERDELKATAIAVQEDLAHWHGKYFDLVKENKVKSKIKDASENKTDLSQSEIDFLKSYLSQSLKDASESISSLKSDAKFFKGKDVTYSNHCYKFSDKLKKKAKVLSGIQSKLKKTVLNRKVQAVHQVKQEGYPEYKEEWIVMCNAWTAVCDAIDVYCPGFISERGTGIECAVRAVHTLGKEAQ